MNEWLCDGSSHTIMFRHLGACRGCSLLQSILAAILAHKGTAAFALGSSFAASGVKLLPAFIMVGIFSLTTPAGIIIAMLATNSLEGTGRFLTQGILIGLAAGTFLYIAAMEMMSQDMHPTKSQDILLRVILFLSGLTIMAVVAIWT